MNAPNWLFCFLIKKTSLNECSFFWDLAVVLGGRGGGGGAGAVDMKTEAGLDMKTEAGQDTVAARVEASPRKTRHFQCQTFFLCH